MPDMKKLTIIHNGLGSGDWIRIRDGNAIIFDGHRLSIPDLISLLNRYTEVIEIPVTDQELEEEDF